MRGTSQPASQPAIERALPGLRERVDLLRRSIRHVDGFDVDQAAGLELRQLNVDLLQPRLLQVAEIVAKLAA